MKDDKLTITIEGNENGHYSIKSHIKGNPIVMHGMVERARRELQKLSSAARGFEDEVQNENAKKEADKLNIKQGE